VHCIDSQRRRTYSSQGSGLDTRGMAEGRLEPQALRQQIRGLALVAAVVLLIVAVRYFLRWI
jgi:hypothetical protein